jgi:hypothetical protein
MSVVDAPTGSVTGTVDGVAFTARDIGASNTGRTTVGTYPVVEVSLLDVPGACLDVAAAKDPPGARALHIWVFNEADQNAIGPGSFELGGLRDGGPGIFAGIFLHELDSACVDQIRTGTGTLTLTEVTTITVRGSIDVSINGGDAGMAGHLSGSFTAPICGPPLNGGVGAVCME